jgi:hypothetical protein
MIVVALSMMGCSIKQDVRPVGLAERGDKQLCIRENPDVRQGFLQAYRSRLERKGFSVTLLRSDAPVTACPLTSTYTANWRWDLALYMAYAEILVYRNGQVAGRASYDALGGGGRLDKFISATTKINELVDELFPG